MAYLSELLALRAVRGISLRLRHPQSLLLLRWISFGSILGLGAANPGDFVRRPAAGLSLGILLAVTLAVSLLPQSSLRRPSYLVCLAVLDAVLISCLLFQIDPAGSLPVFFFLVLIGSALSTRVTQLLLGCTVLSVLYLLPSSLRGTAAEALSLPHLMALPFFYATALHFGCQVLRTRVVQARTDPVERERRELEAILSILESGATGSDLHGVMLDAVCRTAELVDAVRGSIILVEEGAEEKACVLSSSDNRKLRMLPLDLTKYPEVLSVLRHRKVVHIEDVETSDLVLPHLSHLRRLSFRSLLVLPIVCQEVVVGALCLRAARARAFTDGDVRFCRRVALAAAGPLRIAALSRTVRDRSGEQEEIASRIRGLFEQAPDLILRVAADGGIREANGAAASLTGRSRSEILSMGLTSLIRGLPSLAVLQERTRGTKMPLLHEAKLLSAGNVERDLAVMVGAIGGPGGDLLFVGRDVTDQMRTAAMLQHAEKLSSLGEIVASVAHELNNPLLGVTASSELLALKDKEGKFKRDIERIVDCSDRCRKIIRTLLNYARPMAAEKKPTGLNAVVEKTLSLLEHSLRSDNIEVVKDLAADLPDVLADFHQLQQVLTNLITNAQQAMSADKGRGRLALRTTASNGVVVLEVADDGPGITSEALPRIFDPFFSTKKQGRGTGLGLSVSHGLIRDHGGELRVETQVGQGTTFQVILPVPGAAIPEPSSEKPADKATGTGKEILVVDDEEAVVDLFLDLLRAMGHTIDTATTGLQALRKLEVRDYDLVITDIKMPKMSGIDLYRTVVAIKPEMRRRFVFVTGVMNSLTSPEFLTVADSPCLLKPVTVEKMESTIQEVLGQLRPVRLEGHGADAFRVAARRN
jgi:signal transduction histidine kinase/ActR/RegA family two-component response regulator